MVAERSQASQPAADRTAPAASPPPAGFGRLARRISAWTTNGLLTAIIVVAGLGFGRQVLQWWAADGPAPARSPQAPAGDSLGDPRQPHVLRFGNEPWTVSCRMIAGDRQTALAALREDCRRTVTQGRPADQEPAEAERRFLAGLAGRRPVDEEPGKWRLYELDEGLPMVVGVRQVESLADAPLRVVLWGLATPAGAKAWTLYAFQPGTSSPSAAGGLSEIPFPPGCSRLMSLATVGGGSMTAFTGPQQPEAWMRFYDDWFRQQGWRAAGGWQHLGRGWHKRFVAPGEPGDCPDFRGGEDAAFDNRRTRRENGTVPFSCDVQFGPNDRGGFSGFLMSSPLSRRERGTSGAAE